MLRVVFRPRVAEIETRAWRCGRREHSAALMTLKRPSIRSVKLCRYSNEAAFNTGDNGTGDRKEAVTCHEKSHKSTCISY